MPRINAIAFIEFKRVLGSDEVNAEEVEAFLAEAARQSDREGNAPTLQTFVDEVSRLADSRMLVEDYDFAVDYARRHYEEARRETQAKLDSDEGRKILADMTVDEMDEQLNAYYVMNRYDSDMLLKGQGLRTTNKAGLWRIDNVGEGGGSSADVRQLARATGEAEVMEEALRAERDRRLLEDAIFSAKRANKTPLDYLDNLLAEKKMKIKERERLEYQRTLVLESRLNGLASSISNGTKVDTRLRKSHNLADDRLELERMAQVDSEPQPIGKGVFGDIYDQFKGRVKEAIAFLIPKQSGEAVGALYHNQVGYISLVWGNKKCGLDKILSKHPEVVEDLQLILDEMHVVEESDNRIKLESATHFAVVSKDWMGSPRDKWLLSAFEKKETSAPIDKTMDTDENQNGLRGDTALSQNTDVSENKGITKTSEKQENGAKKSKQEVNEGDALNRRSVDATRDGGDSAAVMERAAAQIARRYGVRVVCDYSLDALGEVNRADGTIRVNPAMHTSAADMERTIIHEADAGCVLLAA